MDVIVFLRNTNTMNLESHSVIDTGLILKPIMYLINSNAIFIF